MGIQKLKILYHQASMQRLNLRCHEEKKKENNQKKG